MGITRNVYAIWLDSHGFAQKDVRDMTADEAIAIYMERYWFPAKCELLPAEIRAIHFDAAVNHGVGRALKLLQQALDVKQDGIVGPVTLAAVAASSLPLLRTRYLVARYRLYGRIVQNDRSQIVFIAGWMARLEEFS
ncbi:MAG: hypothetical protein MUF16_19920 [Burkholderiaceae bacterium]|nr:hypothetical protein [Burkholderiaceae bacterium]